MMQEREPPIYMVSIGRVYRRDTVDATHFTIFHQFEGLAVDRGLTLADLRGTLLHVMQALYGAERRVRFRTHYFPFTEPSMEPDVSCPICGGEGCRVCRHSGWIEMGGSGMVDPAVFENVGYDPERMDGLRVRDGPRADGAASPCGPRAPPVLGERSPSPEAVLMRVPLSWLGDYVALPMSAPGARRPAEHQRRRGGRRSRLAGRSDENGNLGLFLVGKVLEAGKHPNADRLQLCQVDVGEGSPRQIVCGAWNFGAGATVAVALPGARLPGADAPLGEAKLRGELSRGMILSERELELGGDHAGIIVLPESEPGTPLADVLPLSDLILDVEPTGNRVDLLCVYGVAREVAALFGLELAPPPGVDPEPRATEAVDIRIDDLEGCPRYVGRTFGDVRLGPSPPWLRARLTGAGMRPISNVVDITNYVMLALGNPLHAFDRTSLAGDRIVVRRAGARREAAHARRRRPRARRAGPGDRRRASARSPLAGIMGGEETEVRDATTQILLEAANFEPFGLLRSSERLKLRTEGSNRWEKGVDPYLAPQAASFATQLLVELADARWLGDTDVHGELPSRPVIRLRPARADELIGLETPPDDQRAILAGFGFDVDGDWKVTVPTWRSRDVTREVDLVEEVARVRLDDVPFTLPVRRAMFGALTSHQRLRRRVEDVLVGLGLAEIYTPSLVPAAAEPEGLALPEPMGDQAVLRPTLLHGLVDAAARNASLGNERIALFEIARVYLPRATACRTSSCTWAASSRAGSQPPRASSSRSTGRSRPSCGSCATRGRSSIPVEARVSARGGSASCTRTLLEGAWGVFELDLGALLAASRDPVQYEDVITFPAVKQDLAFVVDESVAAGDLIAAAREAAGAELRDLRVFDVYRGEQVGEGKKSVALAAAFQSPERTLSDEDAAALRERIVAGARGPLRRRAPRVAAAAAGKYVSQAVSRSTGQPFLPRRRIGETDGGSGGAASGVAPFAFQSDRDMPA